MKRFLIPTAVALVLVGALTAFALIKARDAKIAELFGGMDSLQTILSPERAEAYRIENTRGESTETEDNLHGYPTLSEPVNLDATTVKELSAILLNGGSYDWNSAKGCKFDPAVAIRFVSSSGTTDVLFCFGCDEIATYRDGKRIGGEDIDNVHAPLVKIMKQIFPKDDTIQKLD